eukprot:COSAG04_NODE_1240_length_7596_cov_17.241697_4_plen_284_part_00
MARPLLLLLCCCCLTPTARPAAAAAAASAEDDPSSPCKAKPCPSHPGRTFCPADPTPNQCDKPSHPPCRCAPPGPPPSPLPPPPPRPMHRPWLHATMPIPQRVEALMAAMTFEEKLLQLVMADIRFGPPPARGSRGRWNSTTKVLGLGGWGATAASGAAIGPAAGPHDGSQAEDGADPLGCTVDDTYCRIAHLREVQLAFLNQTRLGERFRPSLSWPVVAPTARAVAGIPISFVEETSHAGGAGGTIFPMGVTQGASWNTSLAHAVGEAIALEARSWCDCRHA